jgi:predicted hydrocarbon binding protein
MPPTVNARIPLSLLEAVRRIDTPEVDTETEYVQELRNKRLGLSDTVYQQIRRYSDAAKRGQLIPHGEVAALGTLIGRRPDARELFISAGRILANDVYSTMSPGQRKIIRLAPRPIARPLALGQLRQFAKKLLGGSLTRAGDHVNMKVDEPVTVASAPDSTGCEYYASALRELLHLLIHAGGAVDHVQCVQRGDGNCEWRAEWRAAKSEAA